MRKIIIHYLFFLLVITSFTSKLSATHILGGEITWVSQGGGSYIFELVIYRDCNGFDVSTGIETIQVWNHPTLSSINVNFIERVDLSPPCTEVAGGPAAYLCGSGTGGGNGSGAIEKIVYRSAFFNIPGTPPPAGWVFTYGSFSRSGNLTNIQNPLTVGITIVAKMFNNGASNGCYDSSPRFLEAPFVVSCAGQPFIYNQNAYDADLDSMVFSWGIPLNEINTSYNPPADPAAVVFEPGFSATSPTPSTAMNPSNVPANLNPQNGELSFTSFTTGNFAIKIIVHSYRNGVLMSEIQREIQVIVENCAFANNAPNITAPFPGNSFEVDVFAGELVNFSLFAEDFGLLQNGASQTTTIQASGAQFGTGFTNPAAGCPDPPCAVLNTAPPVSGSPNAQLDFNWQTDCNHLVGCTGTIQHEVPYNFVFRVTDDVCQIPAVRYATVTVNVINRGVLPASQIECIRVQNNGDVFIQWEQTADPENGFEAYEIHSIQHGLIGTVFDINITNLTHPGAGANTGSVDYFVITKSGCNGVVAAHSDTISSIHLILNNPGNGTAVLQWTAPSATQNTNWNDYYYILREYPAGNWTVVDSVAFGLGSHIDTIDVCSAFLNYRIELPTTSCSFLSNIEGDVFEDKIGPFIPEIQSVSIDTITGQVIITWDVNQAPDTYGYIVYYQDENGFYTDLDTLWGINSTTYITNTNTGAGPLSYSVAAFDSCYTPQVPPTYQTSAKADVHTTHFLSGELDICKQQAVLNWTGYQGWSEGVLNYRIFAYKTDENWELIETVNGTSARIDVETETTYCFAIEAISNGNRKAFSNIICINIVSPTPPAIHYLSTASVEDLSIQIKHRTSITPGEGGLILERWNDKLEEYEEIEQRTVTQTEEIFEDFESNPNKKSYTYRVIGIDSCGRPSIESNIGKTIYLETFKDDNNMKIYLQWNKYEDWMAPIVHYQIHRGIDDVIDPNPLAIIPANLRSYEDDVEAFLTSSGRFCYYIIAREGTNALGFNEFSRSNVSCAVLEPLIYIPNAFTVGGRNPIFRPVVNLYDYSNYEFTVFDRWGQTLFRTNDGNEGWNGLTRENSVAKEGVYLYVIRLKDGNGNEITRRGHVTLLDYRGIVEE